MINLDLNIDNKNKKIKLKEDVIFNALLIEHPTSIKTLIHAISKDYPISETFFSVINGYVDVTENGTVLYPGLIVRTGFRDYAILYLEGTVVEEEYMISLIKDYIHDMDEMKMNEININYFELDKNSFFNALKEK